MFLCCYWGERGLVDFLVDILLFPLYAVDDVLSTQRSDAGVRRAWCEK